MNLRELAEKDLAHTLEDPNGFGWPVTVTNPDGEVLTGLYGMTNDISSAIDPDTGALVSNRLVTVSLRISTVVNEGFELPREVSSGPPWIVTFDNLLGSPRTYKVIQTLPDRGLGYITCVLGNYA